MGFWERDLGFWCGGLVNGSVCNYLHLLQWITSIKIRIIILFLSKPFNGNIYNHQHLIMHQLNYYGLQGSSYQLCSGDFVDINKTGIWCYELSIPNAPMPQNPRTYSFNFCNIYFPFREISTASLINNVFP